MVNSYGSWHDSDEVDSDLEQQAYSLLYYENFNDKKIDVTISTLMENSEENNNKNDVEIILNKNINNSENEYLKSLSENEDITINLLNSSDSTIDRKSFSDSDSDDVQYVPRIKCSNVPSALCIGSSSDDSDFEAMQTSVNMNKSSLMMNVISEDKLVLQNRSVSQSLVNETVHLNSVDKLFFNSKQDNDNWSIDFKPLQKSKFSNRYFESNSKSVCVICTKKGHTEDQCTKSGPICILCGKEGHMSKKCDSVVCFVCFQWDHHTKSCPSTKKFLSLGCKRCGQRGHSDEICPDIWRQYKYTTTAGPPVFKKISSQNKSTVFCANCAKPGHFTEQCPRNRMNSHFLGPPPIMEIIKYDDFDIYQKSSLKYSKPTNFSNDKSSDSNIEFPSFIERMNVTTILEDIAYQSDYEEEIDSSTQEVKNSQFGDGFIMLSPISKVTPRMKKARNSQTKTVFVNSSTPRQGNVSKLQSNNSIITPKVPTKLPGITTELLKKLFPEETRNLEKLPPYLRKKLRKKLKNLIDNGYLPGDSNMTQERMEFWLQEISTGRTLNYREKKKLLGSVSAALHSISDRVSSVEMINLTDDFIIPTVTINNELVKTISVPENRKRRNKQSRQAKNLKNVLKMSRKEKKETRKNVKMDNSIKARLRKTSINDGDIENVAKKNKNRKRKRKSAPSEVMLN